MDNAGQGRLLVDEEPGGALLGAVERSEPANPFFSRAYARAMGSLGLLPVTFHQGPAERPEYAFNAFLERGRLSRTLIVPSMPALEPALFLAGALLPYCRRRGVTALRLESFGSGPAKPPELPAGAEFLRRREFVVDLTVPELLKAFASNHKRNQKRAAKAGVECVESGDAGALAEHYRMLGASMARRRALGEAGAEARAGGVSQALLATGAGRLFQAVHQGEVVSSILVLTAPEGAYYHSGGSSPGGMALGASHFLFHRVMEIMAAEGKRAFNLGGAEADSGLARFKQGFGAVEVRLWRCELPLGPAWRRKTASALRLLRQGPRAVLRKAARLDSYRVYRTPEGFAPPPGPPGLALRRLPDSELAGLGKLHPELKDQSRRLAYLGFNDAYGLFDGDELLQVSWLIPAEHDRLLPVRYIKLRPGEAEITHSHTLNRHRRRGYYAEVIRRLCALAAEQGLHTVFMTTDVHNLASRRGIEKAGLRPCGRIFALFLPMLGEGPQIILRLHR